MTSVLLNARTATWNLFVSLIKRQIMQILFVFVEKESIGSFPHFGFLVSTETVVLRRWESETKILVL